jgi:hypothetical protein
MTYSGIGIKENDEKPLGISLGLSEMNHKASPACDQNHKLLGYAGKAIKRVPLSTLV